MRYLYVCNTSSDNLSIVNLNKFMEERRINLKSINEDRVGPHGICRYKNKLLIANNYNNSLTILDLDTFEQESYFIGVHCNDVAVFKDNAYILCGDLDYLLIFDLSSKKNLEGIPCGKCPHSIRINENKAIAIISSMQTDEIIILDCNNLNIIKTIKVGEYPTKAIFSEDDKYILVCESNLGSEHKGSIAIISNNDYSIIKRIEVGKSPVDLFNFKNLCFVSNFTEGTISIVNINSLSEVKKIEIGGMPRGIVGDKNYIYVGDNYNNVLYLINLLTGKKKVIPIGKEPTGMTWD